MDHLGLVEAVDGLGQGIVVAVADAADGWLDAGLGQALGVFDRDVLAAAIAMMDKAATVGRRSWIACSRASSTKPAWAVLLTRQPTM